MGFTFILFCLPDQTGIWSSLMMRRSVTQAPLNYCNSLMPGKLNSKNNKRCYRRLSSRSRPNQEGHLHLSRLTSPSVRVKKNKVLWSKDNTLLVCLGFIKGGLMMKRMGSRSWIWEGKSTDRQGLSILSWCYLLLRWMCIHWLCQSCIIYISRLSESFDIHAIVSHDKTMETKWMPEKCDISNTTQSNDLSWFDWGRCRRWIWQAVPITDFSRPSSRIVVVINSDVSVLITKPLYRGHVRVFEEKLMADSSFFGLKTPLLESSWVVFITSRVIPLLKKKGGGGTKEQNFLK